MHQAPGTRLGSQRQIAEALAVHSEHPGRRVEDPRGVQRAGQRQVMAGCVGKAGDGSRGVGRARGRDSRNHARGTQGNGGLSDGQAEAESGSCIVTATGPEEHMAPARTFVAMAGTVARPKDVRKHQLRDRRLVPPQSKREEVASVTARNGVEVTRARGIGAVCCQLIQRRRTREPPCQPVMRQRHRCDSGCCLGLMVPQPAQLGDGESGDRHGPDGIRPPQGAVHRAAFAQLINEVSGSPRGSRVIPQQGRADHVSVDVKTRQAVLLTTDRHGLDVVKATGLTKCLAQGLPPVFRIDLGAGGMGRSPLANEARCLGVANDDLARLGGGVNTSDERHQEVLSVHEVLEAGAA